MEKRISPHTSEEKIALEKTKKELELEMMLEEEISDNELERLERIKKMES